MILAYIDPGAGSMVIQALIAAVISVPFFFRTKLRSVFGRFRRPPVGSSDEAHPPSDRE